MPFAGNAFLFGGAGVDLDMRIHDIADAAVTVYDPNGILVASAHAGDVSTVTIAGGLATTNLNACCAFILPLNDIGETRINGADFFGTFAHVEAVVPAPNGCDLWCATGICDNISLALGHRNAAGLHYDGAVAPNCIALRDAIFTNSPAGGGAGTYHGGYTTAKGRNLVYVGAHLLDNAWAQITSTANAATQIWTSVDMFQFVALGRSTNVAGNATLSFSAWFAPIIMRQNGIAPPTTG